MIYPRLLLLSPTPHNSEITHALHHRPRFVMAFWMSALSAKCQFIRLLGFAGKMFTGQLEHSAYVIIKPGKRITLSFDAPMPYHIDGEGMEPTRDFIIQIKPASIRMLVPSHIQDC
jgi:hypothetical protein